MARPGNKESPHILVDARFAAKQRGGDRCRYELAVNLVQQAKMQYTFLGYDHAPKTFADLGLNADWVNAPFAPEKHPQADYFEHIRLPLLTRQIGADIYHGTFNVMPTLPLLRPGAANIVTVHDMAVFAFPQAYGRRFTQYARPILARAIARATRILSVSDATKSEIIRYYPEAEPKITTVMNGVGQQFLDAAGMSPQIVSETLCRLGIETPYVLFVGNLEPKKNLVRLMEAFRRLKAETNLPHILVIIGKRLAEGPSDLTADAGKDESIFHFTGYLEDADLPTLYRGADLVAYPSLYEGYGMPVLEGMAVGVPVLTSNVSSLPEVAGGTQMLVDPLDVEAITRGLYQALTDKAWRQKAAHDGRERAQKLTWAENARQTAEVYAQVYAKTRG